MLALGVWMRKVWWDPCLSVRPVDRSPREIVRGGSRRARKDVPDKLRPNDGPRAWVLPGVGLVLLVVDVKSTIDFPHLVSKLVDRRDTSCVANPVFKKCLEMLELELLVVILEKIDLGVADEQEELLLFWGLVYCWMCTWYLPT